MISYDMIIDAQNSLVEMWGEDGKKVIEKCHASIPYNDVFKAFVHKECVACGGNWGAMLLSGINRLYPDVYDAIPDDMGWNPFFAICQTLILLGVDTSE